MAPVTRGDVVAAGERIAGVVRRTPVLHLDGSELGIVAPAAPVTLKLDVLQVTGSFKARGAASLLAAHPPTGAGVVAASGGNFGIAVAWAAERFGHRATIVTSANAPRAKLDPIRRLGAELVLVDGPYADAFAEAGRIVSVSGALAAHAYDDALVVAGQGTAAFELLEDAEVDTVLVAVGGGGLLAGTIAAVEGRDVRVVAVETRQTATLNAALAAGRPVDVQVGGVAASALGARRIGRHAWAVRDGVAASVLVDDDDVVEVVHRLWESARIVVEPGGATALAALVSGAYRPAEGERVSVVLCGANTDPASVSR